MSCQRLIAFILATVFVTGAHAERLTIAVASNFRAPAEEIAAGFTTKTGYIARISSASTGKLYAQITNGAPFDIFLAADSKHPQMLEELGLAVAGSRKTYATGALVLWSRDARLTDRNCRAELHDLGKRRLAIANPETAPYGIAAQQFLLTEALWERVQPRLVYGENIAQALHFVVTGNAELGLIAKSQALDARLPPATCFWSVPPESHAPIAQQAVVLQRAKDNAGANAFSEYLHGETARGIITRFGYETGQ